MSENNEIFNPKNPIWLEILRYYTIVFTGIGLFASFIAFIRVLVYQGLLSAVIISLIISVSALIFYVIHMVILNALYNLQNNRLNTDQIVEILKNQNN